MTAAIFGCARVELAADEREFFSAVRPWGFILFDRNLRDPAQIRDLTRALRAAAGHDAPILIDQEGGRVARLRPPLARDWPPPREHAAAGAGAIRARYAAIGRELAALGIDVNCVPCADVARPGTHPFLANRCFSDDAAVVSEMARAAVDGCLEGGVLPVVKHIPGHGAAAVDSHEAAPRVGVSFEVLRRADFVPFRALADVPLGMTAHVLYDAIDADGVATVSVHVIRVIREEIGFDGLLMTDDICMGALGGAVEERVNRSLSAGCDLILHCNGDLAEMRAVAAAAGPLSASARARADRALAARRRPAHA
jgi:beta-N-acetylhexosaminidase